MTVCICDPVVHDSKGKPWPDVDGFDADCPTHGYPDDEWRAGSPLYPYKGYVDRRTGEHLTYEEARGVLDASSGRVSNLDVMQRFREETPREVNARLTRELNYGPLTRLPRPLRPCPPRGLGQR